MLGGINRSEYALIRKYRDPSREPSPGYITDYLGNKIKADYHHHLKKYSGKLLGLSLQNDGILHDTAEYFGLVLAIDLSEGDSLTAIELGAGYGPWLSRAGIVAKRKGIKKVNLVGVEADPKKFNWMKQNLKVNGLMGSNKKNVELYNAAVSGAEKFLYFPSVVDSSQDYGNAAVNRPEEFDYRGMKFEQKRVEAIPLVKLLDKHARVDVIFVDIQGSEYDVLRSAIRSLNQKVRLLIIGTHSRKIEGDLIDLLHTNRWSLKKEKPCDFVYSPEVMHLPGMTTHDGCQIWVNEMPTSENGDSARFRHKIRKLRTGRRS
jgi:FkbM family methyltransferase